MRDLRGMIVCLVALAILLGAIAAWQRSSRRGRSQEDSFEMKDFAPGLASARDWLLVGRMPGATLAGGNRTPTRGAPPIREGALAPHAALGPCSNCHKILASPRPSPAGAVEVAMTPSRLPAQEGHWQGMEVIPVTSGLAREYGLSTGAQGVLVDDVTLAAADAGLWAGDVLVEIDGALTPDLPGFLAATRRVARRTRAAFRVIRQGRAIDLALTAPDGLGVAQMEGASMITAGSVSPHRYQGACTTCHTIGTTGQLAVDQGDLLSRRAPPIQRGAKAPHRYRGGCSMCHRVW